MLLIICKFNKYRLTEKIFDFKTHVLKQKCNIIHKINKGYSLLFSLLPAPLPFIFACLTSEMPQTFRFIAKSW